VTLDIDVRQQMNTAVSAMMELVNELYAFTGEGRAFGAGARVAREADRVADRDVVAFRPAYEEELWQMYGHADGLERPVPASDAESAKAEELEIPVQVNGKLRGVVKVAPT
jgi:leucyl-tRNA synthetase